MNILPPRNFGTQVPSQGQALVPGQSQGQGQSQGRPSPISQPVPVVSQSRPAAKPSPSPIPQQPNVVNGGSQDQSTEKLAAIIDRWRDCDMKLRALTTALATQRAEKIAISAELIQLMENAQVENINLKSGKIRVVTDRPYKPLTKKSLIDSLSQYSGVPVEQRTQIANFILGNRTRTLETKRIVHTEM